MRKKTWDADAADSSSWEHGDYWPLQMLDSNGELHNNGYAIVCPYEIIPEVLHRHHLLSKSFRFTENEAGDLWESDDLTCTARRPKFFWVKEGQIAHE